MMVTCKQCKEEIINEFESILVINPSTGITHNICYGCHEDNIEITSQLEYELSLYLNSNKKEYSDIGYIIKFLLLKIAELQNSKEDKNEAKFIKGA